MIKNNKTKGFILVIIAALFWGYLGVPTKNLYDFNFDSFSVCFFRTSIAGIFYFLYCFKKDYMLLKELYWDLFLELPLPYKLFLLK